MLLVVVVCELPLTPPLPAVLLFGGKVCIFSGVRPLELCFVPLLLLPRMQHSKRTSKMLRSFHQK